MRVAFSGAAQSLPSCTQTGWGMSLCCCCCCRSCCCVFLFTKLFPAYLLQIGSPRWFGSPGMPLDRHFWGLLGEGGISGGASLKMSTSTNASTMPVQNRMTRRESQLVKFRLEDRHGSQKMHVGESEIRWSTTARWSCPDLRGCRCHAARLPLESTYRNDRRRQSSSTCSVRAEPSSAGSQSLVFTSWAPRGCKPAKATLVCTLHVFGACRCHLFLFVALVGFGNRRCPLLSLIQFT